MPSVHYLKKIFLKPHVLQVFSIHIYLNNVSVVVSGIIITTTAESPLGLFKVSWDTCGFFFFNLFTKS